MYFLPPNISEAWRFAAHRETCASCKRFDGETRNLGQLCLAGTKLLKDDWVEIEAHRRAQRSRELST
jgi:hypothetical protein